VAMGPVTHQDLGIKVVVAGSERLVHLRLPEEP